MPHEIHAADKSTKDTKAHGKAQRFRAYLVQQKPKPAAAAVRIGTEPERQETMMNYGDSVIVNGRVWVFYDASQTQLGNYKESTKQVQAFLAAHPTGQVCIGLGRQDCPTKTVEGV